MKLFDFLDPQKPISRYYGKCSYPKYGKPPKLGWLLWGLAPLILFAWLLAICNFVLHN